MDFHSNCNSHNFFLPVLIMSMLIEPPGPPTNVSIETRTPTTVTLSWKPPISLGGRIDLFYRLWYQQGSGVRILGLETNSTTGTISGIKVNNYTNSKTSHY